MLITVEYLPYEGVGFADEQILYAIIIFKYTEYTKSVQQYASKYDGVLPIRSKIYRIYKKLYYATIRNQV